MVEHLRGKNAATITQKEVDEYRNARLGEQTRRKTQPAPATLDREIELLNRTLNYAVRCGKLPSNPIANVKLLRQPNVRRMVLREEQFSLLLEKASLELKPILVVAYDTGMRKEEVLGLKWPQLDLKAGRLSLAPQDTKTEEGREIYLTERAVEALRLVPRDLRSDYVFVNPRTGQRWKEIRDQFAKACKEAGVVGLWFHDTRRSFVTNARRRGVPESVVMRMSGHKTRAVFDRYNVIEAEDLKEAVRKIENGLRQETRQVPKTGSA